MFEWHQYTYIYIHTQYIYKHIHTVVTYIYIIYIILEHIAMHSGGSGGLCDHMEPATLMMPGCHWRSKRNRPTGPARQTNVPRGKKNYWLG